MCVKIVGTPLRNPKCITFIWKTTTHSALLSISSMTRGISSSQMQILPACFSRSTLRLSWTGQFITNLAISSWHFETVNLKIFTTNNRNNKYPGILNSIKLSKKKQPLQMMNDNFGKSHEWDYFLCVHTLTFGEKQVFPNRPKKYSIVFFYSKKGSHFVPKNHSLKTSLQI